MCLMLSGWYCWLGGRRSNRARVYGTRWWWWRFLGGWRFVVVVVANIFWFQPNILSTIVTEFLVNIVILIFSPGRSFTLSHSLPLFFSLRESFLVHQVYLYYIHDFFLFKIIIIIIIVIILYCFLIFYIMYQRCLSNYFFLPRACQGINKDQSINQSINLFLSRVYFLKSTFGICGIF